MNFVLYRTPNFNAYFLVTIKPVQPDNILTFNAHKQLLYTHKIWLFI